MTILATADATTVTRPAPARSGSPGRVRGTRLRPAPGAPEATPESADHGTESADHDAGPADHDAGPADHDAGPAEHGAGPAEHGAESAEHDAESAYHDAEPAEVHVADQAAPQVPTAGATPPAGDVEPVWAEPDGGSTEVQPLLVGAAADSGPVTLTIRIEGAGRAGRDRLLTLLRDLVAEAGPGAAVVVATEDGGIQGRATPSRFGGVSPASAPSANRQTLDVLPGPGAGQPGEIRLDPRPRTVARDGWPLHLSRLEYDLLLFLARHPRQVFSRSQLLAQVWGHTHTTDRTVDVHVSRLRTKLGDQDPVTTVYGLGYRLADDALITVAD
jgi:transcriptional regulator